MSTYQIKRDIKHTHTHTRTGGSAHWSMTDVDTVFVILDPLSSLSKIFEECYCKTATQSRLWFLFCLILCCTTSISSVAAFPQRDCARTWSCGKFTVLNETPKNLPVFFPISVQTRAHRWALNWMKGLRLYRNTVLHPLHSSAKICRIAFFLSLHLPSCSL